MRYTKENLSRNQNSVDLIFSTQRKSKNTSIVVMEHAGFSVMLSQILLPMRCNILTANAINFRHGASCRITFISLHNHWQDKSCTRLCVRGRHSLHENAIQSFTAMVLSGKESISTISYVVVMTLSAVSIMSGEIPKKQA